MRCGCAPYAYVAALTPRDWWFVSFAFKQCGIEELNAVDTDCGGLQYAVALPPVHTTCASSHTRVCSCATDSRQTTPTQPPASATMLHLRPWRRQQPWRARSPSGQTSAACAAQTHTGSRGRRCGHATAMVTTSMWMAVAQAMMTVITQAALVPVMVVVSLRAVVMGTKPKPPAPTAKPLPPLIPATTTTVHRHTSRSAWSVVLSTWTPLCHRGHAQVAACLQ